MCICMCRSCGKPITHALGRILKFWISSRGWTTDNTAVRVLLNALHIYKVMTIHLFIILTSGIHSVIAGRSTESAAPGKPLTLTSFLLLVPSAHCIFFFSSLPSLCRSLGSEVLGSKMQGNWIMKF